MTQIFSEIFKHLLGDYLGPQGIIASALIFLMLWFIDTSVIEFVDKRYVYALACGIAACGMIALLSIPEWTLSLLLKSVIYGAIMYVPLFLWMRKHRGSAS